jgi:hypothetical protein
MHWTAQSICELIDLGIEQPAEALPFYLEKREKLCRKGPVFYLLETFQVMPEKKKDQSGDAVSFSNRAKG